MDNLARLAEILAGLEEHVGRLRAEVTRLQGEQRLGSAVVGERMLTPGPRPSARDLAQVILPTRTDDPDWIVGGRRARAGDYPDCCAVGNDDAYYCSGTLIASNVVVTARHCHLYKPVTRVFLKGNDVDRPERGETIRVAKVFLHDEVDLAALLLEEESSVQPRHVAQGTEMQAATEAMLAGFGTIDLYGTVGYGIKRQVKVPITFLDGATPEAMDMGCSGAFEMVAGHRGLVKDTCKGDSGGPLYVTGPQGGYYLLGATSRGASPAATPCGDGGIYIRVDKLMEWISDVTGVEIEGFRPGP